ncbi:MAG: SEC-C metal-binding domain-containing protein [Sporomusaceae bacterium]|nr:SEC-C metal-binding domain-containing protein [Sporomusaceae bacterium]
MSEKDSKDIRCEAADETAEALHQVIEEAQRQEKKLAERLWRAVSGPEELTSYLGYLTKDELTEIRINLKVKNASNLKKQELADLLVMAIPAGVAEAATLIFDEERWRWFKRFATQEVNFYTTKIRLDFIRYFKSYGFLGTGTCDEKTIFWMPTGVKQAFQALNEGKLYEMIRQNTEWIYATQGLLYYYGLLEKDQLVALVEEKGIVAKADISRYLAVIAEAAACYGQIVIDKEVYADYRVKDRAYILGEQKSRAELPYCSFLKQQFVKAGKPGFVDKNSASENFLRFMKECYSLNREEAAALAEDCFYIINNSKGSGDLLAYLSKGYEFPSESFQDTLLPYVAALHNQTRMWVLKGYKPVELVEDESAKLQPCQELSSMSEVAPVKVGRNDPCPCNSGKKYKKCCGK